MSRAGSDRVMANYPVALTDPEPVDRECRWVGRRHRAVETYRAAAAYRSVERAKCGQVAWVHENTAWREAGRERREAVDELEYGIRSRLGRETVPQSGRPIR